MSTTDGDQPPGRTDDRTTGDRGLPRATNAVAWSEVQSSTDFQELRRRLRNFAFPMTAAFLAWYLLYVIMSGWARDFMGKKVLGEINVAYVFGLLQFVSTFVIAYLYSRHANSRLDPLADRIRHEIEGES